MLCYSSAWVLPDSSRISLDENFVIILNTKEETSLNPFKSTLGIFLNKSVRWNEMNAK
jgi:hypothetical protein